MTTHRLTDVHIDNNYYTHCNSKHDVGKYHKRIAEFVTYSKQYVSLSTMAVTYFLSKLWQTNYSQNYGRQE